MKKGLIAMSVFWLCPLLVPGEAPGEPESPTILVDDIDDWQAERFCGNPDNQYFLQGPRLEGGATGVTVFDSQGNAYVACTTFIQMLSRDGTAKVIAGTVGLAGSTDGPPWKATFGDACVLVMPNDSLLYVVDRVNITLRKLEKKRGGQWHTTTIAGVPGKQGHRDGKGSEVFFTSPFECIALDDQGMLYVMDGNWLRKVEEDGRVTTLNAGSGRKDGPLAEAQFQRSMGSTAGMTADDEGNLYIADRANMAIRKVDLKQQVVTTHAGRLPGAEGKKPRDGEALYARFHGGGGPCMTFFNKKYGFLLVSAADEGGKIRWIKDGYMKTFGPEARKGRGTLVGPWRNSVGGKPCGIDDDGNVYVNSRAGCCIRITKQKAVQE